MSNLQIGQPVNPVNTPPHEYAFKASCLEGIASMSTR